MCSLYRLFVQLLGLVGPDSRRYTRVQKNCFSRKVTVLLGFRAVEIGISYAEQLHYNWFCFLTKKTTVELAQYK